MSGHIELIARFSKVLFGRIAQPEAFRLEIAPVQPDRFLFIAGIE